MPSVPTHKTPNRTGNDGPVVSSPPEVALLVQSLDQVRDRNSPRTLADLLFMHPIFSWKILENNHLSLPIYMIIGNLLYIRC